MGLGMRLAFHFAIYQDEPLALRLAGQIRALYPTADIVAICDGPADTDACQQLMSQQGVIVCEGEHLKQWGMGGASAHRNLQAVLGETSAELFIQLDPDSYLWRAFRSFPEADWFGQCHYSHCTMYPRVPMGCLHGAAWGMRREMAAAAVERELLLDPLYSTSKMLWAYPLARDSKRFVPRLDLIWGNVAAELGVTPTCWPEVSGGLMAGAHNTYDWAVTHPVL